MTDPPFTHGTVWRIDHHEGADANGLHGELTWDEHGITIDSEEDTPRRWVPYTAIDLVTE